MNDRREKKKFRPGVLIAIILLSLMSEAGGEVIGTILGMLIILALLCSPFLILWLVLRQSRKRRTDSAAPARRQEPAFDECPKPICFHRDKGEHHVRKGKEMDPWDRPDIDISKYQRR